MNKRQRRKETLFAYIFIGPQLFGFLAFVAFPLFFPFIYALLNGI